MGIEMFACGADRGIAQPVDQPQHEIVESRHHLCAMPRAQAPRIFMQTDIPPIMQPILNGIVTNDKFCMIRSARLKLRAPRTYRPGCHPARQAQCRYPSDEISHRGGTDETSLADSPSTHSNSGWTTTLGPRVSIPPAMDPPAASDVRRPIDEGGFQRGGES